jgi:protein subunit release factor B
VFAHADLNYFAAALNDLYTDYSPDKVKDIILSKCDLMIEQGATITILEREFEEDPIKQKEDEEFTKSELGRLTRKIPFQEKMTQVKKTSMKRNHLHQDSNQIQINKLVIIKQS